MKQGYILGLMLMASTCGAGASTTYSYQGENYNFNFGFGDDPNIPGAYDFNMRLLVSLELSTPLAPNSALTDVADSVLSFSVFDGRYTFNTLGPDDSLRLELATDAFGVPVEWIVTGEFWDGARNADGSLRHTFGSGPSGDVATVSLCGSQCDQSILAGYEPVGNFQSGVWNIAPSPVPLPSTLFLLGSAVGAIGAARMRTGKR